MPSNRRFYLVNKLIWDLRFPWLQLWIVCLLRCYAVVYSFIHYVASNFFSCKLYLSNLKTDGSKFFWNVTTSLENTWCHPRRQWFPVIYSCTVFLCQWRTTIEQTIKMMTKPLIIEGTGKCPISSYLSDYVYTFSFMHKSIQRNHTQSLKHSHTHIYTCTFKKILKLFSLHL
jgi:hypothetical protein